MQLQQGNKVLISCASRTLTSAEKNYMVVEREALAIIYGIKYFIPYLFGRPFLVISDHDCLRHIQSFNNSHGKIVRWILQLQALGFKIVYRHQEKRI